MDQERFKTLAERAGFNPTPHEEDGEAHLLLGKLERFYSAVIEDCALAASEAFEPFDQTITTHGAARQRVLRALQSLSTGDMVGSLLEDPVYHDLRNPNIRP